jgi:hypothetical protein
MIRGSLTKPERVSVEFTTSVSPVWRLPPFPKGAIAATPGPGLQPGLRSGELFLMLWL